MKVDFKWKPLITALIIMVSSMALTLPGTTSVQAQVPCGTRGGPKCPPASNQDTSTTDKRLNTSFADPYVIYCVSSQLQVYKVDSLSRGNLFLTYPLIELIGLRDGGAIQNLGKGFTIRRSGGDLELVGPDRFNLKFSFSECFHRAGVALPGQVDFNCDGTPDSIQVGLPGDPPFVKVVDGKTNSLLLNFMAYDVSFKGGINFALGNFNGDCKPDIVTGAGAGIGPVVRVFDGGTGLTLKQWFAFTPSFTGGVRVAVGDLNGDGYPDIVTGTGPGATTQVKAFDGKLLTSLASFLPFSPDFSEGVFPSVYDANGDGHADIVVTAHTGGHTRTRVFDGQTMVVLSDTLN